MTQKLEKRYDVIIYEKAGAVDAIVGENMRLDTGHYNAMKRKETALMRINDRFDVAIVAHGKYKKGDIFKG